MGTPRARCPPPPTPLSDRCRADGDNDPRAPGPRPAFDVRHPFFVPAMGDARMRSSLEKFSGLILTFVIPLFWPAAGLGLVAVLLGRSAPEPEPKAQPSLRSPAHPRYVGIDGTVSER